MRINHDDQGRSATKERAESAESSARNARHLPRLVPLLAGKIPLSVSTIRTAILLLACIPASAAYAEWTSYFQDDEMEYFLDESTRLEKPRPRLRVLRRFHQPTAQGDKSVKLLYEADCPSRKLRMMSGTYNKGSMGDGEVSGMINSSGWLSADSRPALKALLAKICREHSVAEPVMGQRISPSGEAD